MVETGSYTVNPSPKVKDNSYKKMICSLLVFLALLILISLMLYFLSNRSRSADDKEQKLQRDNRTNSADYLKTNKSENLTETKIPISTFETKLLKSNPEVYGDSTTNIPTTSTTMETSSQLPKKNPGLYSDSTTNIPTISTTMKTSSQLPKTNPGLYSDSTTNIPTTLSTIETSSQLTKSNPELYSDSTTNIPTTSLTMETSSQLPKINSGLYGDSTTNIPTTSTTMETSSQLPKSNPELYSDSTTNIPTTSTTIETSSQLPKSNPELYSDSTTNIPTTSLTMETSSQLPKSNSGLYGDSTTNIPTTSTTMETSSQLPKSNPELYSDSTTNIPTTSTTMETSSKLPKKNPGLYSDSTTNIPTTLSTMETSSQLPKSNPELYSDSTTNIPTTSLTMETSSQLPKSNPELYSDSTTNIPTTSTTMETSSQLPKSNPGLYSDSTTNIPTLTTMETSSQLPKSNPELYSDSTTNTPTISTTMETSSQLPKSNPGLYSDPTTNIPMISTTMESSSQLPKSNPELYTDSTTEIPTTLSTMETLTKIDKKTCRSGVCIRAAAPILKMVSYENGTCRHFYNNICKSSAENRDRQFFFNSIFKKMFKIINEKRDEAQIMFCDFYESCKLFSYSVYRIDWIKNLTDTTKIDYLEIVASSILTQSMPFFDVGLNIINDKFTFEMTLPGLSYLKTSVRGWSLRDQIKDRCVKNVADKYTRVKSEAIWTNIDDCMIGAFKSYVDDTLLAIKQVHNLTEIKNLGTFLKLEVYRDSLMEALRIVQISLSKYRNEFRDPIYKSLKDLQSEYNLGLDWVDIFKQLTNDTVKNDTFIYFSKDLDVVLNYLKSNKSALKGMLNLWYGIQFYNNFVTKNHGGNPEYYCADLAFQLMPEVASSAMSSLYENYADKQFHLVTKLTTDLKKNLKKFLRKNDSATHDIIDEIHLTTPEGYKTLDNRMNIITQGSYQMIAENLIKFHKRRMYNLVSKTIEGSKLSTFFVDPFEIEPTTFPPYRTIIYRHGFIQDSPDELPYYIQLAKLGLPLAEQLLKHIDTKYDPSDLSDINDIYIVEDIPCEVKDPYKKSFMDTLIKRNNIAFRTVSAAFLEDSTTETLPFLEDSKNKTFVTAALQGYCKPDKLANFVGDLYDMRQLPAPINVRNIIKNSELLFKHVYNCSN